MPGGIFLIILVKFSVTFSAKTEMMDLRLTELRIQFSIRQHHVIYPVDAHFQKLVVSGINVTEGDRLTAHTASDAVVLASIVFALTSRLSFVLLFVDFLVKS